MNLFQNHHLQNKEWVTRGGEPQNLSSGLSSGSLIVYNHSYMDNPIIKVDRLTKRFGKYTAVHDISFSIKRGGIVGLLGPNGAGKTTTIRMLLTLITPDSGKISVFGKDLYRDREEILKNVNFTFVANNFGGRLTVYEMLYFYGILYEVENAKKKIEKLLARFELTEFKGKKTRELSSGELSRVALCKALLNSPKILYLDEPTASLDPDMADKTRKLIGKLQKEYGITIIYTSHNMHEVEEMCQRIIFLNKGRIVISGTPLEITKKILQQSAKEPSMREVFIKLSRGGNL
jgi:ABC-2 type transport system ATP-binding protein